MNRQEFSYPRAAQGKKFRSEPKGASMRMQKFSGRLSGTGKGTLTAAKRTQNQEGSRKPSRPRLHKVRGKVGHALAPSSFVVLPDIKLSENTACSIIGKPPHVAVDDDDVLLVCSEPGVQVPADVYHFLQVRHPALRPLHISNLGRKRRDGRSG